MTSKAGRAANAIKTGTYAAGLAIGNTWSTLAPQLAGAIDIMVVRQPDGTLISSPFYVRFGKYTGLRSQQKQVRLTVNDIDAGFTMHLGRTGEAYFILDNGPDGDSEGEIEEDALNGMMSPPSGYSSGDEPPYLSGPPVAGSPLGLGLAESSLQQAAASLPPPLPLAPVPPPLKHAGSAPAVVGGAGEQDPLPLSPRGPRDTDDVPRLQYGHAESPLPPVEIGFHTRRHSRGETLEVTATDPRLGEFEAAVFEMDVEGLGRLNTIDRFESCLDSLSGSPSFLRRGSGDAEREDVSVALRVVEDDSVTVELTVSPPRHRRSHSMLEAEHATGLGPVPEEEVGAGAAASRPAHPGPGTEAMPSSYAAAAQDHVSHQLAAPDHRPPGGRHTGAGTSAVTGTGPDGSSGAGVLMSALQRLKAGVSGDGGGDGGGDAIEPAQPSPLELQKEGEEAAAGELEGAPSGASAEDIPPVHPWSVAAPRHLATPLDAQPRPPVISAANAAAPADGQHASAIPVAPESARGPAVPGSSPPRGADRVELESEYRDIHLEGATAQGAMVDAAHPTGAVAGPEPPPPAEQPHSMPAAHLTEDGAAVLTNSDEAPPSPSSSHHPPPPPQPSAPSAQNGVHPPTPSGPAKPSSAKPSPIQQPAASTSAIPNGVPKGHPEGKVLPESPKLRVPDEDAESRASQQTEGESSAQQKAAEPPSAGAAKRPESSEKPARSELSASLARAHESSSSLESTAGTGKAAADKKSEKPPKQAKKSEKVDTAAALEKSEEPSSFGVSPSGESPASSESVVVGSPFAHAAVQEGGDEETFQPGPEVAAPGEEGKEGGKAAAGKPTEPLSIPVAEDGPSHIEDPSPVPTGMSPQDGGYLGDSESLKKELSLSTLHSRGSSTLGPPGVLPPGPSAELPRPGTPPAAPQPRSPGTPLSPGGTTPSLLGRQLKGPDRWAGLEQLQLSMCGNLLRPDMSPAEVLSIFEEHRISEGQWGERGPELAASPQLVVRLGGIVLRWSDAAACILGSLAFGGAWEGLLPEGAGIPVELPQNKEPITTPEKALKEESVRRSSWRLWLSSWRSTSVNSQKGGATAAAAAAAVAASDSGSPRAGEGPEGSRKGSTRSEGLPLAASELVGSSELALPPRGASLPNGTAMLPAAGSAGSRSVVRRVRAHAPRKRAFVPSTEQLASLGLAEGQNTIDFTFGKQRLRAYIYLLKWKTRLVISDIDGTITRSDLLGHVLPRVGLDWSHHGINRMFTDIKANGYDIMFLSSRAIAQASATRDYLHTLNQNGETLPFGPVIISPDGLFPSLYRELVLRRPHEFKIRCLEDIRALFPAEWNPFYAGFGNRDTDEISYLAVGVPPSKIFIINPRGELRKASSAVSTSTWASLSSVHALIDEMFPALLPEESAPQREEYNDFNYWHVQPPIIIDSDDEAFGDPEGFSDDDDPHLGPGSYNGGSGSFNGGLNRNEWGGAERSASVDELPMSFVSSSGLGF